MKTKEILKYIFYILCITFSAAAIFYAIEYVDGWFWKIVIIFGSLSLFEACFNNIQKL